MKARASVYRGPGRTGVRKGSNLWVPDREQGSLSLGSQTELGGWGGGGQKALSPGLQI